MSTSFLSRRAFLQFMGRGLAGVALTPSVLSQALADNPSKRGMSFPFKPLAPHMEDELVLAGGFSYQVLASWGDVINQKGDTFGFNNDFTAFLPSKGSEEGIMWVNHESPHRLFVGKQGVKENFSRKHVEREMQAVGGSIMRVRKDAKSGRWSVVTSDTRNRRINAMTSIPLIAPRDIAGGRVAKGTFANCCGGVTPWGTILTCEENYDEFVGEAVYTGGKRTIDVSGSDFHWEQFVSLPPEHYGWVVEVEPATGKAKKLTALGRFAHEGATVVKSKDGCCVVYMGDDTADQCIYKFIASKPGSLEQGELFVADVKKGRWISLERSKQPILQKHFKDQTEVLIRAREAAVLVGGSKMDRPEGIQVDPKTGAIYVCLTNNKKRGNLFGSILKIEESSTNPKAKRFRASTFLPGGERSGFACPDNICFDPAGNLWMTTDISDDSVGKTAYKSFGHNSLFVIPMKGRWAGKAMRVASAPTDAELTGMSFTPDGKTLFLSVQHPGSRSKRYDALTSHWPQKGTSIPKPSVVAISGPALHAFQSV